VRLNLSAVLTAVVARVLFVSLLATGVARDAGGDLLYHGAGLGVARGDDADVNGLFDDLRFADVRLVFCGRNLVVVVLTCIKYSNEHYYRERGAKQHHVE
jgi:hypothetical protein